MQTACTHTRHMQDSMPDFAEQVPPGLGAAVGQITFTCSGSEANDPALRIAMLQTGRTGIVIAPDADTGKSRI